MGFKKVINRMVTQHTLAALGEQGVRTAIYLGLTVLMGGGVPTLKRN